MNDDTKRDMSDYTISVDMVDNAVSGYKVDFGKIKCNEVTLASGKRLFEDIPVETIQDYLAIRTEEIYWKNKLDDLNDACKILSAYDIDTDYTEIILRTREAAREAKRLGDEARLIEKKYPTIPATLNSAFSDAYISYDPIWDRRRRCKQNKFNNFAKYLGGANAITYPGLFHLTKTN